MNLAIDIGNTAAKWALFDGRTLAGSGLWPMTDGQWPEGGIDRALACVSGNSAILDAISNSLAINLSPLTSSTPLPIRLDYKTPATLGADRIAAACGAWGLHPGEASLIIDAGTCITVDYLDSEGVYHGGAIMPGLDMNMQALHTFTAKLPLIELPEKPEGVKIPGRSTEESMVAGTLGATLLALAGYVTLFRRQAPELHVLLTGGDAERLAAAGANGWERVEGLTLKGLNEIMMYNEK